MSLINEALKKAHAAQSSAQVPEGELPPAAGAPQAKAQQNHLLPLMLTFAIIAILFAIGGGLVAWGFLKSRVPGTETAVSGTMVQQPSAIPLETPATHSAVAATAEVEMMPGTQFEPTAPTRSEKSEAPDTQIAPDGTKVGSFVDPGHQEPPPWAKEWLESIEVRGFMSGGRRVLIHQSANMRTQAFSAGQLIQQAPPITLTSISENPPLLIFTLEDGTELRKAF